MTPTATTPPSDRSDAPATRLGTHADVLHLVVSRSCVTHVEAIARDLAAGLYEPDMHVHEPWGDFPAITSAGLKAKAPPKDRRPLAISMPDVDPETDIRERVAAICAAPRIDARLGGDMIELMQAIAAVHADADEVDMYGVRCATPWTPFAVTIGVNDTKRPVRAPVDPILASMVPMAIRSDLHQKSEGVETTMTFRPYAIVVSSYDLPTPIEALRILAAHKETIRP